MRVAVLTAGPGLLRTWRADLAPGYGATIAVNRAQCVHVCDWLSAGDARTYDAVPLPRIGWVAMEPDAEQIRARPEWASLRSLTWRGGGPNLDLPVLDSLHGPAPSWSIVVALALAHHLGASAIDVYGGEVYAGVEPAAADCAGFVGEDRSPERWHRERAEVAAILTAIAPVTFITPEHP